MNNKNFKQLLQEELNVSNQKGDIVRSIEEMLNDLEAQEPMLQKVVFLLTSEKAPSESTAELMNIYSAYKKALSQIKDYVQ